MYPVNDEITIPILADKHRKKVVKFLPLYVYPKECSKRYWNLIKSSYNNGTLWGVYLTKTGRIRANII